LKPEAFDGEVLAIVGHQGAIAGECGGSDNRVGEGEGLAFLALCEFEHTGAACDRTGGWICLNAAEQAIGFSGFVGTHSCVDLADVEGGGCEGVSLFNKTAKEMTPVATVAENVDENSGVQQDDHRGRLLFCFAAGVTFERKSLSWRRFLIQAALPDASSG